MDASDSEGQPSTLGDALERLFHDADARRLRSLQEYVGMAPRHESAIARAYAEAKSTAPVVTPPAKRSNDAIGPFRLLRKLGRGGQSIVYLAEDGGTHGHVALKVLTGLGADYSATLGRFRREGEVASRLNHPGICTVLDSGIANGIAYIAMQYVEGSSLAQLIASQRREETVEPFSLLTDPDGRFASLEKRLDGLLELFERAAVALHAAHEAGVVHRDIKPGNIMVSQDGQPVLLDFGLARSEDDDLLKLTRTGDFFGTPAYMPPEQVAQSSMKLDRRSDVYSLGASLFESLSLRRPFEQTPRLALFSAIIAQEPQDIRVLAPDLPDDVAVIVESALKKQPDERFQTALELAEALGRVRRA